MHFLEWPDQNGVKACKHDSKLRSKLKWKYSNPLNWFNTIWEASLMHSHSHPSVLVWRIASSNPMDILISEFSNSLYKEMVKKCTVGPPHLRILNHRSRIQFLSHSCLNLKMQNPGYGVLTIFTSDFYQHHIHSSKFSKRKLIMT